MPAFVDITGLTFGRLTVLGISHRKKQGRRDRIVWHCRCTCGTETRTATTADLRNGNTWSCGCFRDEQAGQQSLTHGHTAGGWSLTFRSWSDMKTRCYNPNYKQFRHHGGRGIKVCKRWLHSFDNFLADMGERKKGLVLDRINNDGNYEPVNCRWATYSESNKNRRKFKPGARKLTQWSRLHLACVECNTTERKHFGQGRCQNCWNRVWRKRRQAVA